MKAQDYATLALAKLYYVDSYIKISPGIASQFFGVTGMLDALEANISNTTLVQLTADLPQTTVGALCRTVLLSAKTTGFTCEPGTTEGDLNAAGAAVLVAQGIFIQSLVNAFFAKALVRTFPFINMTEHQFKFANKTLTYLPIVVEEGLARISVNQTCETHNPQIHRLITFADNTTTYKRVAGFINVGGIGPYECDCPNLPNLFVDDAYGVIS
jgi:hypothetical protein